MDEIEIINFARDAVILTVEISAPVMIVGLVVGLVIALIQALTQVQEQTITFVPKILAIFLTIFLGLPLMTRALIAFTEKIADKIVNIS